MNVIKYLKENGIEKLKSDFKIKVREYPDLIVLNYDQLDSPKLDPIVIECRMLILDKAFNVVARSFNRFFNLNETKFSKVHELTDEYSVFEKRDGSLIGIYFHNGKWNTSTKSTAYGEMIVGISRDTSWKTFHELILIALELTEEEFQNNCNSNLDKNECYIFELTSPMKTVVKEYNDYQMTFLCQRNKHTGKYSKANNIGLIGTISYPVEYHFKNLESCIDACSRLIKLDEGFVIYKNGIPHAKLKSILYLTTVYFNDTGYKKEKIYEVILINEQDEFLTYFPEYEKEILDCKSKYDNFIEHIDYNYLEVAHIEDQKDFAVKISKSPYKPYKSLYFLARKMNKNPKEIFNEMSIEKKANLLASLK